MPRLNCLSPHESAIAPHFLALPDYESDRTSYELTVRASDGGLHADVTVTVNVTDVEEQSVVEDTVPEPLPSVSEPYYTGGDFSEDVDTTGTVEVGGSVTGEIEAQADEDWFAVTLEAGRTYQIDMEGSSTDGGTLENPFLYAMRDANGSYLRHADGWLDVVSTADRDSGEGLNARVTFTPDEDATYYVVAGNGGHMHADDSHGRSLGTYTLSVEEVVDAI